MADCPADQTVTADGTTTVNATAVDTAGNTATTTVVVRVDRTKPSGAITTPNNTVFLLGGHLSGTATDTTSGIDTVTVTYSAAATVTATATCDTPHQTCTWTAPVPTPTLGGYTATAHITDQAGNTTTATPIHITTVL
ncbi:MAG: hypothetical protein QOG44_3525 [Acidimicrobiaceae bacterium]|nr:hypothetical protein [Acidimicrobiaceae bacterium]